MKPLSLELIEDEEVLEFIKKCTDKEYEHHRPTASQLLNSEFLTDLESKKNSLPIKVKIPPRKNSDSPKAAEERVFEPPRKLASTEMDEENPKELMKGK